MQLYRGLGRLVGMPRDNLRPEELVEPADKAARERLEAEMQRALWAQRASRTWAIQMATGSTPLHPNL